MCMDIFALRHCYSMENKNVINKQIDCVNAIINNMMLLNTHIISFQLPSRTEITFFYFQTFLTQ